MNLKEALDTANYVCILSNAPTIAAYGPFTPEEALDFCAKYNAWNVAHGFPESTWAAVPILPVQN